MKQAKEKTVIVAVVIFILLVFGTVGCPIRLITGISCGGCGMTRALICMLCGNFRDALQYHPLFGIVPIYALIYVFRHKLPKKLFDVITYCTIGLFVAVYIVRLFNSDDTVVTFEPQTGLIFKFIKNFGGIFK